jgi:hypothetical protein
MGISRVFFEGIGGFTPEKPKEDKRSLPELAARLGKASRN